MATPSSSHAVNSKVKQVFPWKNFFLWPFKQAVRTESGLERGLYEGMAALFWSQFSFSGLWWLPNCSNSEVWSKSRQGGSRPPKYPQGFLNYFRKDTEDWTVPANSFVWKARNQSPRGKTDLREIIPTKPTWHTPGLWTPCWLNQC